ncbi:MAG: HEPN domain-containing protein [Candidatus Babeliales bacterium]|nr:HEPN domain-containing protein [Candidatus Babeliales bacterium]
MQEHKQWLLFAKDDLMVAKTILHSDYIVMGAICYHAQQCAEKALKAYLVYKQINPRRTHDLSDLIFECAGYDDDFLELVPDALEINPYSHRTRYPDSLLILDLSIAQDAINRAAKIFELVQNKID